MVSALLRAVEREIRGLHQTAYLLGAFALFSQLLALIRDRMLAHTFGAGEVLDVYYAAFRIPDFLFATVASLLSLYAVLPVLTKLQKENPAAPYAFIDRLLLFFFVGMGAVSLGVYALVPDLIPLVAPGFSPEAQGELATLTRILLLQPILLGASNLIASITQLTKRFILYAVSPVLYNIGIIGGIVFLYPALGMEGLAWGVVGGAVLHCAVQIPSFLRGKRSALPARGSPVGEVLSLSFPRTITLAAGQISLFILVAVASVLEKGSVSLFMFAFNLQAVPLTIIAVSYAVAAFPTLAAAYAEGRREEFLSHIAEALRHLLFWSVPAAVLLIVLRAQVVRVILGSGAFDWEATRLTAALVALFSLSLLSQGIVLLLTRGYYAAGATLKPLLCAIISVAVSGVSVVALLHAFLSLEHLRFFTEALLRVEHISTTPVLMVALAWALGSIVQALLLLALFSRDFGLTVRLYRPVLLQGFSASVVGGACAYGALALMGSLVDIDTFAGIFAQGCAGGLVGVAATAGTLALLKNKEFLEILAVLRKRSGRVRAAVEPSDISS